MPKLVICNWKMNGDIDLVSQFVEKIDDKNVVIALPNVFIAYVRCKFAKFKVSAQDCSIHDNTGPYTGEISAKMLSTLGVEYVIIGHSERRKNFFTDSAENVYNKIHNVVKNGMIAVLCVDDNYETLIDEKTKGLLKDNVKQVILAYEPMQSIGTGVVPKTSEISQTLLKLKEKYFVQKTIYGGSVNSSNVNNILAERDVDGVLVGGASLNLPELQSILQCNNMV
ncbi:MAG: triose-phosphate isomerase [Holosporales bacterium]|jgi:triosephosphate isomerase|nr:triose-phosphate isomerase [Holosporales bacterium]